MELLLFLGVAALVVGVPLVWYLARSRPRPGATRMILLAVAAGEAEMSLWREALTRAGIHAEINNVGDSSWYPSGAYYSYEVWVSQDDAERARHVLGID